MVNLLPSGDACRSGEVRGRRWAASSARARVARGLLPFFLVWSAPPVVANSLALEVVAPRSPSVRDAVEMVRIQRVATEDGRVGALSPDGRRLAFVTWHGDLAENTNVYRLQVLDLRRDAPARTLATRRFDGVASDPTASPFAQLAFAGNDRLVFLGRFASGPDQVFALDVTTGVLSQETHEATSVRQFVAAPDGRVRLLSVAAPVPEEAEAIRLREVAGGFLWDRRIFAYNRAERVLSLPAWPRQARQYRLGPEASYRELFDSRAGQALALHRPASDADRSGWFELYDDRIISSYGSTTGDPAGRHALIYPYNATSSAGGSPPSDWKARLHVSYGLVDLGAGSIRVLEAGLGAMATSANGGGAPVWSRDGRYAAVFLQTEAKQAPRWIELNLASLSLHSTSVPAGWRVVGWNDAADRLIVAKDNRIAAIDRIAGEWSDPVEIGRFSNLNWRFGFVTNGDLLIGVSEGTVQPPELVALDLRSKRVRNLTDLNPDLRGRRFGRVRDFRWSNAYDEDASGLLILPVGYRPGQRYPLVVLLDDGTLKRIDDPFLLDGFFQLGGHAAQAIVSHGMIVLYARTPSGLSPANECERMREHVESAVAALGRDGLVDPERVGVSGWSRAGYHANCIAIHSRGRIAASSQIDGGAREYFPALRPFTDRELARVRNPILLEIHGPRMFAAMTPMADRLEALGRPTEVLYFPSAAHDLARPEHRRRSLEAHVDWWRFWLKDEEDPAPAKAEQYRRWRDMRQLWSSLDPVTVESGTD